MVKVIGKFDAIIPKPIVAAPDIINALNGHGSQPGPLMLSIRDTLGRDTRVLVSPAGLTEPALPEHGELPMIESFYVCITREVAVQSDSTGKEILSRDDEEKSEEILIEAVKRVVSAIKKRTEQASIDTRRPVGGYRCSYDRKDGTELKAEFPTEPESYRMPRYALASLPGVFTRIRPQKELDKAMWADLQGEVHSPVALPLHEELIHDAEVLQKAMRCEQATLCAAIAVELMLNRICSILLRRKGLQGEQVEKKLARKNLKSLPRTIKKLDPGTQVCVEKIDFVREERNNIAHGKSPDTPSDRMVEIIKTADEVRRILDDYEQLSEEGG